MKIGLFVSTVGRQDGGPETYERRLVDALPRIDRDVEYQAFCLNSRARQLLDDGQPNLQVTQLRPASRWVSIPVTLPFEIWRSGLDLYHATLVPPPWAPASLVFTMHDVSPFTHPQFYPANIRKRLTYLIRKGLDQARLVICISRNALESTAELFDIPEERLAVAYHGVESRFHEVDAEQARARVASVFGLHEPYLLYVGKLESRKNTLRLIEAYHAYRQASSSPLKLVLAGRRFWDIEDIDATIQRLGLEQSVVETGYVADEDLPALYAAARMFVFPTLWEGFGLPVLEAMAAGVPVITSQISCLPEIAGNAALLVDPFDVEDIAAAMLKLDENEVLRTSMIQRGRERSGAFTWEACARQTLSAYRQALALPPRRG